MIDITKIDDEIRYLDSEPSKKFGGGHSWLVPLLLLAPYIAALMLLLVGTALQAKW
jgi:hypothetical protein